MLHMITFSRGMRYSTVFSRNVESSELLSVLLVVQANADRLRGNIRKSCPLPVILPADLSRREGGRDKVHVIRCSLFPEAQQLPREIFVLFPGSFPAVWKENLKGPRL